MLNSLLRWGALLLIVMGTWALGRSGVFEAALTEIEAWGPWAKPAFVLVQIASVIAFVPSVIPNIAAGAVFGVGWGFGLAMVGGAVGAIAAFGLAKTVVRHWVEARFADDSRFRALSALARKRGWRVVALARLTPVFPFAIGNYAFGVTSIPAKHYFFASLLGMLPSTLVYVYLGAALGEVAVGEARERTPAEWTLLVMGGVVTVVLAIYLRRLASEALADAKATP